MKCQQCGNNAFCQVGPANIPLCINCHNKLVQSIAIQDQIAHRQMQFLKDEMADIVGVPRKPRPVPVTQVFQKPSITNIKIERSQIGVVNTGTIQRLDAAVSFLKEGKQEKLSQAIVDLTQAVLKNADLQNEMKNNLIELISAISTEAVKQKQSGQNFVGKALISILSETIKTSAALSQLWEKVGPIIESVFI